MSESANASCRIDNAGIIVSSASGASVVTSVTGIVVVSILGIIASSVKPTGQRVVGNGIGAVGGLRTTVDQIGIIVRGGLVATSNTRISSVTSSRYIVIVSRVVGDGIVTLSYLRTTKQQHQ